MSANLDLARSILAAWERGDYSGTEWAHPEIEWVIADGPSPAKRTGLAGMAKGWRDVLSSWDAHRVKAADYRELDDERVLVFVVISARGKASGLELGQMQAQGASLFHVRAGKVTRLVLYSVGQSALADLGLDPQGGSP